MSLHTVPVKQITWMPLPMPGFQNIEIKQLITVEGELRLTMMKFLPHGEMPAHQAPYEFEVICMEGSGFVSVGEESIPLKMGERVTWPANVDHRLWTTDREMITLMVEKRYAHKEGSHQVEA